MGRDQIYQGTKTTYMKIILILISFSFFNLNAQNSESKTFNDITAELYKDTRVGKYIVKVSIPSEHYRSGKGAIYFSSKQGLYEFMELIISADTRKIYSGSFRWSTIKNGDVIEKFTLVVRHAKKSDYINIGKTTDFKFGNYGVLRSNAIPLYNYLNELRRMLE